MKARAKDGTNARQDAPAETGGNPKALPKSGFPFAASIENLLSGVEGEDDFVLEGPAAGAKRARVRNMIATPSRSRHRRPKPHHEIGPHGSAARCPIEGMKTMPHPANCQANDPQVPGVPSVVLFAQTHEETGPRGSAAHLCCLGDGRRSIGGTAGQASPGSESNCRATHDGKAVRSVVCTSCRGTPVRRGC